MQAFDSLHELRGYGNCGFENHAMPCMGRRDRGAVEAEPNPCVYELAATINEVRHPKPVAAQVNRDFAPRIQTQQLALNCACRLVAGIESHLAPPRDRKPEWFDRLRRYLLASASRS